MSSSKHKTRNPTEKNPRFGHLPLATSGPQECALTGSALLNTPYFNKGAAFTADERKDFKLTGLLPANVATIEQQLERAYRQYSTRPDDLAKNIFMTSLGEQNVVLYYRVCELLVVLNRTLHGIDAIPRNYAPWFPQTQLSLATRDSHAIMTNVVGIQCSLAVRIVMTTTDP